MKNRQFLQLVFICLALVVLLAGARMAFAQISTNFDVHWVLFSNGGGSRGSASYSLDDSIGQGSFGASTSANFQVVPGFWAALISKLYSGFIPFLAR